MRRLRPTAVLPAVLVAALAAATGACGGRPSDPATTGTTAQQSPDGATAEDTPMSVDQYHVVAIAYHPPEQMLGVRLASGVFRYGAVPQDVADRFVAAKDRDAFFRNEVKGKFPAEHLTPGHAAYDRIASALDTGNPIAPQPPVGDPPLDWQDPRDAPDVGTATMLADGTLHMQLRSETPDGIAEALMIVKPDDQRYAGFVEHLGGIKPGESRSIPPFPAPEIDPDSIK